MPDPAPLLHQRLFVVLGCVCFGLGVIGAVVPLLPTTPFLLLAAACWARSSRRFHDWLLRHRVFGPTLRAWEQHRALPPGVKPRAIALLVLVLGTSAWFFVPDPVARALVGGCGLVLAAFLARLPVREP
ncbi:MAG: DUF454 domain-containing protein [Planctomycetes bacterium]|nr:DUF454 domain-containing protein [Planctomycetota bacterium]